ncbi:MAG: cytochrome c-type biogenesis CcmF C-terminal domain-containing protein, partial [Halofilum sp. (in: g-proteobacteria)]|nr:cytochrome c-type biogenesis CcmF C-terminal domain-containing protein [Halofilum sp. (in: g-proteobacteria)]
KLSVGPPWFNVTFVPLMVLLLALLGFGQLVRYKRDTAARVIAHMRYGLPAALIAGLAIAAMLGDGIAGVAGTALGLALAIWVAWGAVQAVRTQLSPQRSLAGGLRRLPAGVYGMALAHIGLAVTVAGITVSSAWSEELRLRMAPGDRAEVAGYEFRFEGVAQQPGPNYRAERGTVVVTRDGREVARLQPEKRFYASGGRPMTEAGIDPGLTRDLYVSLGEPLDGSGAWSLRLNVKPLVRWIWLGAALMAAGGLVAAGDRRYRSARERRAADAHGGLARA